MNIKGQAINHNILGGGVVMDLTDDKITICFPQGNKEFVFPDAFKKHLAFTDKKTQQYIISQISEKESEKIRQQKESELQRKLINFEITANSHAVFDIMPKQTAQVLKTFVVSTGKYLVGHSKGKPRIADRLKPNSVCLITERPTGKPEEKRRIIGAFMVKGDFFGEDCHDGLIEGHPEHRMLIPAENPLLFWEHFSQKATPRWGNTAFKYCSGTAMNQILSKMVQMLEDTDRYDDALAFYQYFCKVNRIRPLLEINQKVV